MNDAKYIGLDVHQATISVAVRDSSGKADHGSYPRNERGNDSAVYPWHAWQLVGDLSIQRPRPQISLQTAS
jgi:hypothetical protein